MSYTPKQAKKRDLVLRDASNIRTRKDRRLTAKEKKAERSSEAYVPRDAMPDVVVPARLSGAKRAVELGDDRRVRQRPEEFTLAEFPGYTPAPSNNVRNVTAAQRAQVRRLRATAWPPQIRFPPRATPVAEDPAPGNNLGPWWNESGFVQLPGTQRRAAMGTIVQRDARGRFIPSGFERKPEVDGRPYVTLNAPPTRLGETKTVVKNLVHPVSGKPYQTQTVYVAAQSREGKLVWRTRAAQARIEYAAQFPEGTHKTTIAKKMLQGAGGNVAMDRARTAQRQTKTLARYDPRKGDFTASRVASVDTAQ